jgi:small multidrug resistance family-3 protein
MQTILVWLVFTLAAALEVGGDALVRHGLRSRGLGFIAAGFLVLGCYGVLVNLVDWDFSRLLGVYVAIFAVFSVLFGRFFFRESIPGSTWAGLALIIAGGLTIQFGRR